MLIIACFEVCLPGLYGYSCKPQFKFAKIEVDYSKVGQFVGN